MEPPFPIPEKYLSHLGDEELSELSSILQFRRVLKNKVLIEAGKPVKDVYLVKEGVLKSIIVDEKGREVNTHMAWNGMFITAYYSLINRKPADESVVSITNSELFFFSYKKFSSLFDKYPKIERLGRINAEEAFSCYADRGRMLLTMTAKERYSHFMQTTPSQIFQHIPMQDIASYLGIAPGSLSRIRNELLHIC